MLAADLDYDLPEAQIAQHPPLERDGGRMLVLGEPVEHSWVRAWPEAVPAGALVVLNDTRVNKARVFGAREGTHGKVELLFLNPRSEQSGEWEVLLKANRPLPDGAVVLVGEHRLTLGERTAQGTRWVRSPHPVPQLLAELGHVPLPPYVRRADETDDERRYQTVYARHAGSAAAPTAGMHLTHAMLERLQARGAELAQVTLHVGAGTFKPVSSERLADHPMHEERYEISDTLAAQFRAARRAGRPVVAVGTTVVRALESACTAEGTLAVGPGSTRLLISPGYEFRAVDALLTNFHAPRSTLLALVFALAGIDPVRRAYAAALALGYRFLSYGDAMWIPRRQV